MKSLYYDAVVIGAGAAGMAAALELDKGGLNTALIDREDHLGGILMQCIHTGFGITAFNEELTGPEYAERFIDRILTSNIDVYLNTTIRSFKPEQQNNAEPLKELTGISDKGLIRFYAKLIILAMGCRERNRGNLRIPGSRPAGVYTAGLAQRLVNIEGYIPGKEIVIIGSGDIGLIMARRMSWVGCKVHAVVEIRDTPSGLTRNVVQCLNDNNIPLLLSTQVTKILGNDRVEGVEIIHLGIKSVIKCDTVLLSVGLIPENELSREAGLQLNNTTGGPIVDEQFMTAMDGVFACGNVLHVHDLVDAVTKEAEEAAHFALSYLQKNWQKE